MAQHPSGAVGGCAGVVPIRPGLLQRDRVQIYPACAWLPLVLKGAARHGEPGALKVPIQGGRVPGRGEDGQNAFLGDALAVKRIPCLRGGPGLRPGLIRCLAGVGGALEPEPGVDTALQLAMAVGVSNAVGHALPEIPYRYIRAEPQLYGYTPQVEWAYPVAHLPIHLFHPVIQQLGVQYTAGTVEDIKDYY
ncbi:hypothetical protein BDV24DRAFT_170206 [Aspergillus arachidicola]|uniref:Uncharacterized protein n=1 Tax=Aspergillus arachidicola TaxID=656916 RepID=A0A5N6XS58_9EURO|nr:hypothetical protein BDV24DRAFT_170206 [Aspergillus arachidicola]